MKNNKISDIFVLLCENFINKCLLLYVKTFFISVWGVRW